MTRSSRRREGWPERLVAVLVLGIVAATPITFPGGLEAQTSDIVVDRKLPVVNEHRFMSSSIVPAPFITTHLRSQLGFGLLFDARIPFVDVDGEEIELQGDIGLAILGFEYQQAIGRSLALRAGFGGAFRTGTTGESLVAVGLNAAYDYHAGATVRAIRASTVVLSVVADYSRDKLYTLDPLGFAKTIVERCRESVTADDCDVELEDGERLLKQGASSTVSGGVRAAYSPAAWIGLLARAEIGSGTALREADRLTTGDFGLMASLDANPVWAVPLGLSLAVNAQSFGGRGSSVAESATRYGLGLFYTGRTEFNFGIDASFGRVELIDSVENVWSGALVFRLEYIF